MNSLKLGQDRALYLGELPATGWHRHACPVLLVGLSGRFAVHLDGGRVETCRSALIDAGVEHVFDPQGESVALMYLEPDTWEARALRQRFLQHECVLFDPVDSSASIRSVAHALAHFDVAALLRQPLSQLAQPRLDDRIARRLPQMRRPAEAPLVRDALAASAGLSGSRFNHVFRAEMGVSYRSYRVWLQIRAALIGFGAGANLTHAAQHGGFSDSAHFSRMFRQTFALTPSSVLKPLRSIELLSGTC